MSQYIWICPNCRHQFQGHVFDEGTYGSGPICNTCCVELEFLHEEDVGAKAALNEPSVKKQVAPLTPPLPSVSGRDNSSPKQREAKSPILSMKISPSRWSYSCWQTRAAKAL